MSADSEQNMLHLGSISGFFVVCGGRFRPPDTLRPERGQPSAELVQIHQRKVRT
jgi:hypothetical protein